MKLAAIVVTCAALGIAVPASAQSLQLRVGDGVHHRSDSRVVVVKEKRPKKFVIVKEKRPKVVIIKRDRDRDWDRRRHGSNSRVIIER